MAKNKKRTASSAAELEMTPMIDVVFQLLIYFVVTMKPMDIAAHLDVFSPGAPRPPPDSEFEEPPEMIRIMIHQESYVVNERVFDGGRQAEQVRNVLARLAAMSTDQTIMIHVHPQTDHRRLVEILDGCASVGLSNLSIVTMN